MKINLRLIKTIIKRSLIELQQIYLNIVGSGVECNVCHYKAIKFNSDSWHRYSICPTCSSSVRQRLLVASLTFIDKFNFDRIIKDKTVLHFAPEKSIGKLIQGIAKEYKTADFLAEGYEYDELDYNIDISDMKSIQDETFDCVIACDVLEHVPDDKAGIREVYRILAKGGGVLHI